MSALLVIIKECLLIFECVIFVQDVFVAFIISPVKTEFDLFLLSQKYDFVKTIAQICNDL